MKKKIDLLPLCFFVVLTVAMGAWVLIRAFLPAAVLPKLDIPAMVLLTLLAVHLAGEKEKRNAALLIIWGALGFGLLPVCAGMVEIACCWKYALAGGVVFPVTTALYTSLRDRLSSGPVAKAAPFVGALCLWLASQCFAGMMF